MIHIQLFMICIEKYICQEHKRLQQTFRYEQFSILKQLTTSYIFITDIISTFMVLAFLCVYLLYQYILHITINSHIKQCYEFYHKPTTRLRWILELLARPATVHIPYSEMLHGRPEVMMYTCTISILQQMEACFRVVLVSLVRASFVIIRTLSCQSHENMDQGQFKRITFRNCPYFAVSLPLNNVSWLLSGVMSSILYGRYIEKQSP